jgi:hypothetical protein
LPHPDTTRKPDVDANFEETWELPDGAGTITLGNYIRWASFQIAFDPGDEDLDVATDYDAFVNLTR